MKKFLLLVGLMGSSVYAQDYYSPTSKEKEPLARFPLTDFSVKNNTLSYTLPKELVGIDTNVELEQESDVDGIRKFVGPKGTAVCMGAGEKPGCVVTHRNLPMNRQMAANAITQKFAENSLQREALLISKEFQLESGNEPIGFIGALKTPTRWEIPGSTIRDSNNKVIGISRKVWNASWGKEGNEISATLTFDTVESTATESSAKTKLSSGGEGSMKFKWYPYHASGTWSVGNGGPSGWFDITFSSDMSSFEGYYGSYSGRFVVVDDILKLQVRETIRQGRISGKEVKQ